MARERPAPLDRAALTNYALRLLSGRAMSSAELRTRLRRRAAEPADIEPVMTILQDAGYLDDRRFAESYATARLENQGFGRMRVLRDLRQRRVSGDMAASVVNDTFEGTDEAALIEQYLARKYRGKNLPEFLAEDKNLASAFRRLRMAGFNSTACIKVLKRHAASADELEDGEDDPKPES